MKVVIAIDSFKGSLTSNELGDSLEIGIKKVYKDAEIIKVPIADGGEGTVEAMVEGTKGQFIDINVHDPLMNEIVAKYGILGNGKTAIIEMAAASGLPLVPVNKRNPKETTTYGTGEIVRDAINRGCREFIIGLGGSATNDGGLGMMQALGFKFLDKNGNELGQGGKILGEVAIIDDSEIMEELKECKFLVACDVDNPFYGPRGAAYVYGRQKGADDNMIIELDNGLKHLAEVIKNKYGKDISDLAGAGAAGGLGGGLVAFLNAILKPGTEIILEEVGLAKYLDNADFVITGEGRIDFQSVMGKAPVGVSKMAKKYGIPVIGIAGCLADDADATHDYGIDSLFSIMNYPITLEDALKPENAKKFVTKNAEEIFRLIKVCETKFTK